MQQSRKQKRKVLLSFALSLASLLLAHLAGAQACIPSGGCSPVGKPYVNYMPGYCYGLLDRYLAKSIMFSGIPDLIGQTAYCDNMDLLKELQPAYISRAVGSWGGPETTFLPGGTAYVKWAKVISDINKIYCNMGLRLPIIETGIYEAVTTDVNNVKIPGFVFTAFASDPDFITAGYGSSPPIYFNVNNMRNTSLTSWSTTSFTPDINRVETRMWFYYLSSIYIDMGCNSLHMGWWDRTYVNDAPNYSKTYNLFTKIRNYATAQNTFVVINADVDRPIYANGSSQFVLDFLTTPIRPDPTNNSYAGTPCEGNYMAELSLYKLTPALLYKRPGITPLGCPIENLPVLFNLDWYGIGFSGYPPSLGMGDGFAPWGVNESIWFYLLTPECQSYWLKNVAYAIKNNLVDRGYVKMPGIQDLTWWGYRDAQYMMKNYPQVVKTVKEEIYNINSFQPAYTINIKCEENCGKTDQLVSLDVPDPDGTSIYTWHIFDNNSGHWLDYTYGKQRIVRNLIPGNYTVYLRQDNISLPYYQDVIELEKQLILTGKECGNYRDKGNERRGSMQSSDVSPATTGSATPEPVQLKVFPNPAKEETQLGLTLSKEETLSIWVTDISGNKLMTIATDKKYGAGSHTEALDTRTLNSGTYFIITHTQETHLIRKLSVVK